MRKITTVLSLIVTKNIFDQEDEGNLFSLMKVKTICALTMHSELKIRLCTYYQGISYHLLHGKDSLSAYISLK